MKIVTVMLAWMNEVAQLDFRQLLSNDFVRLPCVMLPRIHRVETNDRTAHIDRKVMCHRLAFLATESLLGPLLLLP